MKEKNTYNGQNGAPMLPETCCENPFIVPNDYFVEANEHIIQHCFLDETVKFSKAFELPERYFEESKKQILSAVKVDTIRKSDGSEMEVPKDYFHSLSSRIQDRIQNSFSVEIPKEDGFATPESYFETSAEQIQNHIFLDKHKVNQGGFEIPVDYFESLTRAVEKKTIDPIVQMNPGASDSKNVRPIRKNSNFRYGIAASVALAVSVAGYFSVNSGINIDFSDNTSTKYNNVAEVSLQNISDEELKSYIAAYSDEDDLSLYSEYLYEDNNLNQNVGEDIDDELLDEYIKQML